MLRRSVALLGRRLLAQDAQPVILFLDLLNMFFLAWVTGEYQDLFYILMFLAICVADAP